MNRLVAARRCTASLLSSAGARPALVQRSTSLALCQRPSAFAGQRRWSHDDHSEDSYEQYTARYLNFFNNEADDLFELSRGMNNAFSADLVPPPEVLVAAMQAARRLNSFALAARVIDALREKIDDPKVYAEYIAELKPVMEELGVPAPEDLGR